MAEDEIERLLREVQAGTSGSPASGGLSSTSAGGSAPVPRGSAEGAPRSAGGRMAFAGIAAGVSGVGAFLVGVFTPWTDALDMGFAAAVAAFVTAAVAGPPRWFSS